MTTRNDNWQGMNWIRQEKRLAIYLRDGCACVWCSAAVEDGVQLTLDHYRPVSKGGDNATRNLVTACTRCNSSRGNRSAVKFSEAVASYLNHGVTGQQILEHVKAARSSSIDVAAAKKLIARRGSAAAVLRKA